MHIAPACAPRIPSGKPLFAALLCTVLGACAAAPPVPSAPPGQPPVTAAFFSEKPEALFAAAKATCSRPGEEFHRPDADTAQCRMPLSPEATAGAILRFDGDIHDLPQLVIGLTRSRAAHPDSGAEGWLVTGCVFLRVPQKNGQTARVVHRDRRIGGELRKMLDAVGGAPVAGVPQKAAARCFAL